MRLAQAYVAELEAEIERLRAAVVWHCEACGTVTRSGDCDCTKMETGTQRLVPYDYRATLNAEIERLRTALRKISDLPIPVAPDIARAALEGKFPTKKICPECGQPMREGGYCDHIPF